MQSEQCAGLQGPGYPRQVQPEEKPGKGFEGVLLNAENNFPGFDETDAPPCNVFSSISGVGTRRSQGWDPKAYYCMSRITSLASTKQTPHSATSFLRERGWIRGKSREGV
jgi:hypothetical protein